MKDTASNTAIWYGKLYVTDTGGRDKTTYRQMVTLNMVDEKTGNRNGQNDRMMDDFAGAVYFLQRKDGLVKIGHSAEPRQRYRQLEKQYGENLELLAEIHSSIPQKLEAVAHNIFESSRIEGEWFKIEMQQIIGFSLLYDFWGYSGGASQAGLTPR